MSALSIQVPFPVFQGRDGQPLENGYVWIGEPNLNPQTNPVVAYYDAALTIPAAQPLRTLNGYISRAGTPAQIYIDGVNFSILVQDSKGSMVYNFPDGTGISPNASGIEYDPPFSGAVTSNYTVEDKLAQTVSVDDFGAVGDGVTDDSAAFTAAFAFSQSVELGGPNAVYRIASFVGIPNQNLAASEAFYLIGNGATIKIDAPMAPFTSAAWAANQTLTGNPFTGKMFVENINFIGNSVDGAFDCDHIYNLIVTGCHFDGMNRVFTSRHAKTGHPNGYIQSLFVSDCIFSQIYEGIILAKNAYNVVFDTNQCEDCDYGITINGTDVYAVNTLRVTNNLFEGGGVFVVATSTLAGTISGNYLEENTRGDIGVKKCHFDLTYDTVAVGASNPSTWVIDGNSSQDNITQRNDADFGMVKINGSFDTVVVTGNWANSAVTVSPIRTVYGNYSRRLQNYIGTTSTQQSGFDSRSSVLPRPLSFSLSGTTLTFASLTLEPNAVSVPYRGCVLDLSVVLKSVTAGDHVFGECAFDCKVFISPYGSGVEDGYGKPTYWDVKGVISNFVQQSSEVVDNRYAASTVPVFTSTPTFNIGRSGNILNLLATNFNAATIPNYGAITRVDAFITASINGLSTLPGTAVNWIRFSN
jgi:hypothetical protein